MGQGNQFQTRVYPIPAKGTRTVSVRYVTELMMKKGKFVYQLPVNFDQTLERFHARTFIASNKKPTISWDGTEKVTLAKEKEGYFSEFLIEKKSIRGQFTIGVPVQKENKVLVSNDPEGEGTAVFSVVEYPTVPKRQREGTKNRRLDSFGMLLILEEKGATQRICVAEAYFASLGTAEVSILSCEMTLWGRPFRFVPKMEKPSLTI